MEKFAGLNFHSFNPTKVSMDILDDVSLAKSAFYLRVALVFTGKLSRCS